MLLPVCKFRNLLMIVNSPEIQSHACRDVNQISHAILPLKRRYTKQQ